MGEVRFYHLVNRTLEAVLPVMLERTLARGQRALVRGTDEARLEALSRHLWTYREESFLPHGTLADGRPQAQPILLTAERGNPNRAEVLFLVDGAETSPAEIAAMAMTAVVFRSEDPEELARARALWKTVVAEDLVAVYWAEDENGGWVRRRESGR